MGKLRDRQLGTLPDGRHPLGDGLYLQVRGDARSWIFRAQIRGKRRELGLGPYPAVKLASARTKALGLRSDIAEGGDPFAQRDDRRKSLTFREAAEAVHAERKAGWSNGKHVDQWLATLEQHAFPAFGDKPVGDVRPDDVRAVLATIWLAKPETARRVFQRIKVVTDWAVAAGYRDHELPERSIRAGLPRQPRKDRHFAALPWPDMPATWAKLVDMPGMGAEALRFTILTAARSGEVRGATWAEIDLDGAAWTIPAERMKMRRDHRVPLSEPAVRALRERQARTKLISGHPPKARALVFPGQAGAMLSDMTLSAVLKRMGLAVTVHGFRSTFRDWAAEATDHAHELAEAALAHAVANRTEAAYRRGDLFERRRQLMDDWAAYITGAAL